MVLIALFLLINSLIKGYDPSWIDGDHSAEISEITHYIYQRYYLIARTENSIKLLFNLHKKSLLSIDIDEEELNNFSDEQIRENLEIIIETKEITPIFSCWQHIILYQRLQDDPFQEEFSKLLLLILQKITGNKRKTVFLPNDGLAQLLDIIDIQTDKLSSKKTITRHSMRHINHPEELSSITPLVAYRFYLLKRIENPMHIIKSYFSHCSNSNIASSMSTIHCFHEQINAHLEEIIHSKSITPLLNMHHELEQFRHINDMLYVKEFFEIVLLIAQQIQAESIFQKNGSSEANYTSLDQLSIEDLLEAIDITTGRLPNTQEKQQESKGIRPLLAGLSVLALLCIIF